MSDIVTIGLDLAKNVIAERGGGDRAAFIYTLIGTAKFNDVEQQARLAVALARIADTPMTCLDNLLPWIWAAPYQPVKVA